MKEENDKLESDLAAAQAKVAELEKEASMWATLIDITSKRADNAEKDRDEACESLRKSEAKVAELELVNIEHYSEAGWGIVSASLQEQLRQSEAAREQLREALQHVLEVTAEPEKYGRYITSEDRRIVKDALSSTPAAKPVDGITDTDEDRPSV